MFLENIFWFLFENVFWCNIKVHIFWVFCVKKQGVIGWYKIPFKYIASEFLHVHILPWEIPLENIVLVPKANVPSWFMTLSNGEIIGLWWSRGPGISRLRGVGGIRGSSFKVAEQIAQPRWHWPNTTAPRNCLTCLIE